MAFSIRSLFNSDNNRPEPPAEPPQPPQNLLFKIVEGKTTNSGPVNTSAVDTSPLTIGDILSVLPASSLAEKVPDPFAPLPISRDVIEKALKSGEAALPLHEIYNACPALFRSEITSDDSRKIALPSDKIVKLLAGGITHPASPPSMTIEPLHPPAVQLLEGHTSVFSVAEQSKEETVSEASAASLQPDQQTTPPDAVVNPTPASPFTMAGATMELEKAPTAGEQVPQVSSSAGHNPFERINALGRNESASATPPPLPAEPVSDSGPMVESTTQEDKVTMSLPFALKYCKEEEIGIDPTLLPDSVDVTLSRAVIERQIASGGKPAVKIRELRAGLINEHKILLAAARPDLSIRLPVGTFTELGHEEHEHIPDSSSEPSQVSSFLIDDEAEDESDDVLAHSTAAASTPSSSPLPTDQVQEEAPPADEDPFAEMPLIPDWGTTEGALSNAQEEAPFDFPPLPGFTGATPQTSSGASASNFPPAPTAPQAPSFGSFTKPVEDSQLMKQPSPATSREVEPAKSVLAPAIRIQPRSSKHRRMLLRLLLGTQEDLNATAAVEKILTLPGVQAVGCIHESRLFASASKDMQAAKTFVNHILPVHQHILPLAQLSGLDNTETVTLRSEEFLASFALHPTLTLAILHEPGKNETELLEKITLLTTEVAGMLASEAVTA